LLRQKMLYGQTFNSTELRLEFKQQKKSSYGQANFRIWFGNLNEKAAKLVMKTFAYQSTSHLVYIYVPQLRCSKMRNGSVCGK